MSSERGYVSTGELANAFVAAHDTSLISSNPEAWGRERAINNLKAIDAGVEAVRARLAQTTVTREQIREAVASSVNKYAYCVFDGEIDSITDAIMAVIEPDTEGAGQ